MKKDAQRWFAARLLFEALDSESDESFALEDRIVVVRARSTDEASEKATKFARESETEYEAAAGNRVRWQFRKVADIQALIDDDIADGTEIYFSHIDLSNSRPLWTAQSKAPVVVR